MHLFGGCHYHQLAVQKISWVDAFTSNVIGKPRHQKGQKAVNQNINTPVNESRGNRD